MFGASTSEGKKEEEWDAETLVLDGCQSAPASVFEEDPLDAIPLSQCSTPPSPEQQRPILQRSNASTNLAAETATSNSTCGSADDSRADQSCHSYWLDPLQEVWLKGETQYYQL
jgi:hypothetical protein